MSITFTVTCDTGEELAYVLENLTLQNVPAIGPKKRAGRKASATKSVALPKKKATSKSGTAKKSTVKKSNVTSIKKAKIKATKSAKRTGKRQPGLTPILRDVLDNVIKLKKPFRSKDVIDQVMKQNTSLKESSVTTGVNKLLSETKLKFETIKNPIGRSYKLYKP